MRQADGTGDRFLYSIRDGVSIAYATISDGAQPVVYANGWPTQLDVEWEAPQSRGFLEALVQGCTLIAFTRVEPNGNVAIYIMDTDGTGQTRLTNSLESAFSPAWQPQP